ncbi:MAG: hypothetical protein R3C56_20840 [Pirellulaceae bacterium]
MIHRFVLILMCVVAMPSVAQEAAQKPSWIPKSFPDSLDLASLSIAKIIADKKAVQIARPVLEITTKTKQVTRTVMQAETRTRQVGDMTEDYTVQVPVVVVETIQYGERIPRGAERIDVPINKAEACDLAGNLIDATTLAARLQKPAYVLAIVGDLKTFQPIDPFYLNVLRPDTIVIFLPAPAPIPDPAAGIPPTPIPDPAAGIPPTPIPAPTPDPDR